MPKKGEKTHRQCALEKTLASINLATLTDAYIGFTLNEGLGGLPIPEQLERTDLTAPQRARFETFAAEFALLDARQRERERLEEAR